MKSDEGGVLRRDRTKPPLLVPLVLLGCKVEVTELSQGGAYAGGTYSIVRTEPTCGGKPLRAAL